MNFNNIIENSYNATAKTYTVNSHMQAKNMACLIEEMAHHNLPFTGKTLDLGCGAGLYLDNLRLQNQNLPIDYTGVDLSEKMLSHAQKKYSSHHFIKQDMLTALDQFDESSFDIVVSNAALHWLIQDSDYSKIQSLISKCSRLLRKDGFFAVSMAGQGTATRLLNAYTCVMKRHRNEKYFCAEKYVASPFGQPNLSDVIDWLFAANLKPISAGIHLRPIHYSSPKDYIKAVKAYGEKIYTAAISDNMQSSIWKEIENEFQKSFCEGDRYLFDQGICMFLAQPKTLRA